jgi:hypothetical protein
MRGAAYAEGYEPAAFELAGTASQTLRIGLRERPGLDVRLLSARGEVLTDRLDFRAGATPARSPTRRPRNTEAWGPLDMYEEILGKERARSHTTQGFLPIDVRAPGPHIIDIKTVGGVAFRRQVDVPAAGIRPRLDFMLPPGRLGRVVNDVGDGARILGLRVGVIEWVGSGGVETPVAHPWAFCAKPVLRAWIPWNASAMKLRSATSVSNWSTDEIPIPTDEEPVISLSELGVRARLAPDCAELQVQLAASGRALSVEGVRLAIGSRQPGRPGGTVYYSDAGGLVRAFLGMGAYRCRLGGDPGRWIDVTLGPEGTRVQFPLDRD